jgi:short-subunit dehydrogenase
MFVLLSRQANLQTSDCASKHGLSAFSQALWEEVRNFGIKVCAINPGFAIKSYNIPCSPVDI